MAGAAACKCDSHPCAGRALAAKEHSGGSRGMEGGKSLTRLLLTTAGKVARQRPSERRAVPRALRKLSCSSVGAAGQGLLQQHQPCPHASMGTESSLWPSAAGGGGGPASVSISSPPASSAACAVGGRKWVGLAGEQGGERVGGGHSPDKEQGTGGHQVWRPTAQTATAGPPRAASSGCSTPAAPAPPSWAAAVASWTGWARTRAAPCPPSSPHPQPAARGHRTAQ